MADGAIFACGASEDSVIDYWAVAESEDSDRPVTVYIDGHGLDLSLAEAAQMRDGLSRAVGDGIAVSREDLTFTITQLQAHVAADAGIKVDSRRCNETAARLRLLLGGSR